MYDYTLFGCSSSSALISPQQPSQRSFVHRHNEHVEAATYPLPGRSSVVICPSFRVRACLQSLVRVLLDPAAGRRASKFWGTEVLSHPILAAATDWLARIVSILITCEGEGRQRHWARVCPSSGDMRPLFGAASKGSVATVAVLLAAGADELARDNQRQRAGDYAGLRLPADDVYADGKTSAFSGSLERAPAFRARS